MKAKCDPIEYDALKKGMSINSEIIHRFSPYLLSKYVVQSTFPKEVRGAVLLLSYCKFCTKAQTNIIWKKYRFTINENVGLHT